MANYHVIKSAEDAMWEVIREGAERASSKHATQQEAEAAAKDLAATSGGGEVRIHELDGKIRDSNTIPPAHDPFPPRDKQH